VTLVLTFVLGAFCWTFVEYALHRGLGHRARARNPFSVEHLKHHATVTWFAPTWKKGLAAIGVLSVTAPGLVWGFGAAGFAGAIGFASCYVLYEWVHRRLHTHPGQTRYGRWARRHHLHHHFSRPRLNHGVTTPLWDWVFGTLDAPQVVQVPTRNALPWMLDGAGALRPELAGEYVLGSRSLP